MLGNAIENFKIARIKRRLKSFKKRCSKEVKSLEKSNLTKAARLYDDYEHESREFEESIEALESDILVRKARKFLVKLNLAGKWEVGIYGEKYLPYDIRVELHDKILAKEKIFAELKKEKWENCFKWITAIASIIAAIASLYAAYNVPS